MQQKLSTLGSTLMIIPTLHDSTLTFGTVVSEYTHVFKGLRTSNYFYRDLTYSLLPKLTFWN